MTLVRFSSFLPLREFPFFLTAAAAAGFLFAGTLSMLRFNASMSSITGPCFGAIRRQTAPFDGRRTAVRNREFIAPAEIPSVEQAAHAWLEGKKVSESKHGGPVKQSTIEHWQNHIHTYIVPTLGRYRMDVVDTAFVEKKRDEWKAIGTLSGKTINKVMTTLDAVFQKQLALRTIRYNPVRLPSAWHAAAMK